MQHLTTLLLGLLLCAAALGPGPAAAAEGFDDGVFTHIVYPDWFKDSFLDLQEDLDEAVAAGKHGLMVFFSTEGCSYCGLFIRESLGDPAIAAAVQERFVALGLEIFSDAEMTDPTGTPLRVKQFATAEGAEYAPTLLFYDHDGQRVLRAVGYQSPARFRAILDYVGEAHYRTMSFRDYVRQRLAVPAASDAPLQDDPLFASPPYALDRSRFAAERPLLVLFEQPGCAECTAFHRDVLGNPEVREMLKGFEVVRLDAADQRTPVLAPDGSRLTPAVWFEQAGFSRLPALLFYNEQGQQVLQTDALVKHQRMLNSMLFVLEKAYEKGWTYQRLARSKGIERAREQR
jgi:thioredoxin-related protein